VLDQGKLVAVGTHAQLITAGGVYADLYRTQLDAEMQIVLDPPSKSGGLHLGGTR
jgi:ATP-binding cassette subfamily B protein